MLLSDLRPAYALPVKLEIIGFPSIRGRFEVEMGVIRPGEFDATIRFQARLHTPGKTGNYRFS